jgi:hypothetical protein
MNKYEQLVEFIINDETDKARELFHNIVVEKSRDIYESLIDEADLDEVGGNQVQGLVDEISLDEEGISEEEEAEDEFGAEEESDMDFDDSGDLDSHEEEHASDEERIDDLEAALDELKAEFDALMADEAGEEEHADMDFGSEEEVGAEEAPEQFYEAEECDTEEEDEEELDETIVREYVEKVGETGQKSEGGEVGKGKSASINKGSIVAGKNDFGGSSKNIATGKAEQNPDGRTPNASVKPQAKLKGAGSYENVPGAKAGNAFAKKETGKTGEGQTTGKSVGGVNTKSPLAK